MWWEDSATYSIETWQIGYNKSNKLYIHLLVHVTNISLKKLLIRHMHRDNDSFTSVMVGCNNLTLGFGMHEFSLGSSSVNGAFT